MIILFKHGSRPGNARSLCDCNRNGWRIRPEPAETGTHETNDQPKTETVTK